MDASTSMMSSGTLRDVSVPAVVPAVIAEEAKVEHEDVVVVDDVTGAEAAVDELRRGGSGVGLGPSRPIERGARLQLL